MGIENIIPIFYVRGYNPPYTEGHNEVVRGMVRSLLLQNMRSVIFNYKYNLDDENAKYNLDDENANAVMFEQNVPLIDREDLFHLSIKPRIAYAALMETLAIPRFLSIERYMSRYGRCIVNVVNCFRYPRFFAKKFSELPVVLHLYTRKIMIKNMIKMLLDRADMVITSSKTLASYLAEKYYIDKLKIRTIYPLVDTEVYRPFDKSRSKVTLGLGRSTKILLYIGNLRLSRFPQDTILALMKKLVEKDHQTKLMIFSPKNRENMNRSVEILAKASAFNLRQNVKIEIRNLSEVEKSVVYSASDIFLFPPLESEEAVEPPLTVLEAMSSGLPVVSSDVASTREVIANEVDGLIMSFRNEDLSLLEERVSSLLQNDKARMDLSYNARRTMTEKLSLYDPCKTLVKIYRDLSQ